MKASDALHVIFLNEMSSTPKKLTGLDAWVAPRLCSWAFNFCFLLFHLVFFTFNYFSY
jgi:hypothetical protein